MATNYAYATYTEVIDLQTVADTQTIIGIHTPVGMSPYNRLRGFFQQFRKYKYNGIKSLIMVPAAQLPVDPLGLTGVVGTTDLMDPRDTLNPILFHGCHGENLDFILNQIYNQGNFIGTGGNPVSENGGNVSPSADEFKVGSGIDIYSYYSKLTDSSWRKFGIQSGVKLSGLRPLVHQVVQNMVTLPGYVPDGTGADYIRNAGLMGGGQTSSMSPPGASPSVSPYDDFIGPMGNVDIVPVTNPGSSSVDELVYKQQFTNKMTNLGWLPTSIIGGTGSRKITMLPKSFMGVLVMPPAYNVEQYFRCVITHSFSFRDFTSSLGLMELNSDTQDRDSRHVPYANWIDYGEAKLDVKEGDTLDMIGGDAAVVSDGVM